MEKMLSAPVVVAIWAVLNGLLAAMLAGFGENYFALQLYGSAAAFVLVLAGLVWLGRRYRPWQRGWRQPAGTGSVALFAIGVMLLWLGLAFGKWVAILAAFPFLLALVLEILVHVRKTWRQRAPRTRARSGRAAPPAGLGQPPDRARKRGISRRVTAPITGSHGRWDGTSEGPDTALAAETGSAHGDLSPRGACGMRAQCPPGRPRPPPLASSIFWPCI
jgi:hypothetical protein